jgi:DNA-binding NarL/FixJ family response regulator
MSEPIEVVIVEDHPAFRLGVRARLDLEDDIRVTGEAATAEQALGLIADAPPDVALIDLNLPGMDGVALTRELAARAANVRVLVLTMLDDEHVFSAVRAGAMGYLLKDAEPSRIVTAIRTVAAGDTVFSPAVARRLLSLAATGATRTFGDLSVRETEILTLMAQGLTNAAIARRLSLSPKTIRNNVSTILGKLQAADRAEAILRARDAGLAGGA